MAHIGILSLSISNLSFIGHLNHEKSLLLLYNFSSQPFILSCEMKADKMGSSTCEANNHSLNH